MLNLTRKNIFYIKKFNKIFSIVVFILIFLSSSMQYLYASVGDRVRSEISYNSSTKLCDKEGLKFDPFFTGNPDVNWEISNPVCLTLMATSVVLANASDYFASKQCNPLDATAEVNAALKASFFNPALLMIGVAKNGGMCGSYASICALNPDPVTKAAACQSATRCCASWGAQLASYGAMVGSFAIVYKVAKDAYEDARICGHKWLSWEQDATSTVWTKGAYDESRAKTVSNSVGGSPTIGNQNYREFIYGGVEYEDNGSGACKNPTGWDSSTRTTYLGYSTDNQRYYMKGAKETPSFACYRFLVNQDKKSETEAFECCQKRSQNTICLERNNGYKFCKIGDNNCSLSGNGSNGVEGINSEVYYNIYESRKNAGYICAETYSVCPYNHPLGGGTEDMSTSSNTDGNPNSYDIANYCQYMYHCSKIPSKLYFKTSNLSGSFISQSCRDMKGDSQNNYNFTSSIIGTNSFSSAIVQCFKETLENAFFNKAGYTKCVDANEEAKNGVCDSGYIQKKGGQISGDSFFVKMQKKLKNVIKILLTLSVIFFGAKIAMGEEVNKKLIVGYIAKIAVIIYFVIGDAWQTHFMKGVMDSSNFLAGLMFSSDYDLDAKKAKDTNKSDDINFLDGCQFPRYNYSNSSDFENPKYAPGNEYLKIWDTLDCKIARAIGMAPGATTANLILTILAGFFTGGLGILFVIAVLAFAIFLIHLVIQAFHMFLVSMLAIIILIFVSPITITMALFDKTKNIFDSWLSELLGYALQPMIIYAYLGIFIALFDTTIVGKETMFQGDGRQSPKTTLCADQNNNTNTNANSNSIYCIFGLTKVKNYTGFEALGIGIPQLVGLIDNKLAIITILKSAFLFIIFSFAGAKIPDLARALVGGSSVDGGDWSSATKALGQLSSIYSSIRSTQQKGMGLARKIGGSVNDARRDYRHNLDQYSNKKDEDNSGGQSSQQPVKLEGGATGAEQKIHQTNQVNSGGKENLTDNNQNQPKGEEVKSGQENKAPEIKTPEVETTVAPEVQTVVPEDKTPEVQNPEKSNDVIEPAIQSNNEVDDKKDEVINQQDNNEQNQNPQDTQDQSQEQNSQGNANNIDQPAELTNNKEEEPAPQDDKKDGVVQQDNDNKQEQNPQDSQDNTVNNIEDKSSTELTDKTGEEPVLNQGDNQNKSENKVPDNTTEESNDVISNQQQIQSNANQEQNNNIPINNSKPAIPQNNNKTIAKPLIGNQKRKRVEVGARIIKDSALINDSGERKFLGNIDKGIEKNFKDPNNIRMQEFAMNADSKQIQTLKNNMNIKGAKQEKEFNQNMLKAAQAYEKNNDLKNRDSQDLVREYKTPEKDAQEKMNEKYQARIRMFNPKK